MVHCNRGLDLDSSCHRKTSAYETQDPNAAVPPKLPKCIMPPKVIIIIKRPRPYSSDGMACSISVMYSLMCASILRYSSCAL